MRLLRVPLELSHPNPPGPDFHEESSNKGSALFQLFGNSSSDFGMRYFATESVEINDSGIIFPKLLIP